MERCKDGVRELERECVSENRERGVDDSEIFI